MTKSSNSCLPARLLPGQASPIHRYTDEERPRSYGKCYDCGLKYDEFPCDMVIQDELWEMINPSHRKQGGLLCPNCICARLIQLGLTSVHVMVNTATLIKER